MLQTGAIELAQYFRRSAVFQMTHTSGDALLERPGIVARNEHGGIMIALKHQAIADGKHRYDMWSRHADIGQHAESHSPVAHRKLRRFLCIVRNRKGLYFQLADIEGRVTVDQANLQPIAVAQPGCVRAMGHP